MSPDGCLEESPVRHSSAPAAALRRRPLRASGPCIASSAVSCLPGSCEWHPVNSLPDALRLLHMHALRNHWRTYTRANPLALESVADQHVQNLMKGYISREHGIVVLSKNGAFPGTGI